MAPPPAPRLPAGSGAWSDETLDRTGPPGRRPGGPESGRGGRATWRRNPCCDDGCDITPPMRT
ncbi:MAG: hypothetical protein DI562_05140 [Stenotrophomonas acidaminiphila]|nr:MAG: hypothetical protein DI562_05140 [Stenotrophomonas acidaminiphila]